MVTSSQKRYNQGRKEQCDFTKVMMEEGDWIPKPNYGFNLFSVKESGAVAKESVFYDFLNLSVNFVITYIFSCEEYQRPL